MTEQINSEFQRGDWDTPGWEYAKNVVVFLADCDILNLEAEEVVWVIEQALRAATESKMWLKFLTVVSEELQQVRHEVSPNKEKASL